MYRLLDASTFAEFIDSVDRDKFYKSHIEANKKFKGIQLFVWLKIIKTANPTQPYCSGGEKNEFWFSELE